MATSEIGRFDGPLAVGAKARNATLAEVHQGRGQVARVLRPERATPEGLIEALTALSSRFLSLKARNRELAGEVKQLGAECGHLQSRPAAPSLVQPVTASEPTRPRNTAAEEAERRRLERDLHDSIQNELVALLVKLTLIEQDRDTPPALAGRARIRGCSRHSSARLGARDVVEN